MLHSGSNIVLLGQVRLILFNLQVITPSRTDVALKVDWIGWVGSCIDLFTLLISANIVKNVKVSKTVKISKNVNTSKLPKSQEGPKMVN